MDQICRSAENLQASKIKKQPPRKKEEKITKDIAHQLALHCVTSTEIQSILFEDNVPLRPRLASPNQLEERLLQADVPVIRSQLMYEYIKEGKRNEEGDR